MPDSGRARLTPSLILGLGILTIGLLFTAEQLGIGDADIVFDYWPLLVIAIGATKIGGRSTSDRLFALIWMGVGAWLLAWNLDYLDLNPFRFFWPGVLILVGVYLMLGGLRRRETTIGESMLNVIGIMGGGDRNVASQALGGGDITAFMGGGRIDLRQARLAQDEVELRVFVMWGGYEIRVPPDWEVAVDVLPLLGGVEDKRTHQEHVDGAPKLTLKGIVIMGGIEVKT